MSDADAPVDVSAESGSTESDDSDDTGEHRPVSSARELEIRPTEPGVPSAAGPRSAAQA